MDTSTKDAVNTNHDLGNLNFLTKLSILKETPRKGWLVKVGIKRPESVADHCFRTAMMALVFSYGRPELDKRRLIEMALIHDLAEIETGDLLPEEKISSKEELGIGKEILASLEPRVRKRLLVLLAEYHNEKSPEAIILRQLDKLEMATQAREYERKGHDRSKLADFWGTAREAIHDSHLIALLKRTEKLT
ncbi:MAG: HD domain-containing protein [Nitrososphaerales archaeon]